MAEVDRIEAGYMVGGGIMLTMPEAEAILLRDFMEQHGGSKHSMDEIEDRVYNALRRWV